MRKIKESFRCNGFDYQLIERKGNIVIYSQSKKDADNDEVIVWGYEVHKVRVSPMGASKFTNSDGSIRNVILPERERLAGNEDFGKYGWACDDLEQAEQVFKEKVMIDEKNQR